MGEALYMLGFSLVLFAVIGAELCPEGGNISPYDPENPDIFDDVTEKEMNEIIDYMFHSTNLNLVRYEEAVISQSFIYTIESLPPKKAEALAYLDRNRRKPDRYAKVIVFRGDRMDPAIEEYKVGPLPHPTTHQLIRNPSWPSKIPWNSRSPIQDPEEGLMLEMFSKELAKVDHILSEYTGGYTWNNCTNRCLTYYPGPPGSVSRSNHKQWVWLLRDIEGHVLHPVGLQFVVNLDNVYPSEWKIDQVWFQGKYFATFDMLAANYRSYRNTFKKLDPPKDDKMLFSSLNHRGNPFPKSKQRGPKSFYPDGNRFSVDGHHVEWLGWSFRFNMRTTTGMVVRDIRFNNERIVYEISPQEHSVMYSGHTPAFMHLTYQDSMFNIGQMASEMIRGVDCPTHAMYFDFVHYLHGQPTLYKDVVCLFELDRGIPLRRHHEADHRGGYKYYQGMPDNILVLRTIMTVWNYDYVIDYHFHQDGKIEVKNTLTGYTIGPLYTGGEQDKYGFQIAPDYIGVVHNHFANFKVDLDIKGTLNRFETLDVKVMDQRDPYYDGVTIYNRIVQRNLKRDEMQAAYKYDFDTPKYLLFYNKNVTNKYGNQRAYRLIPEGMTKMLMPKNYLWERGMSWGRYQVAVTKRKDSEETSSSIYNGMEPYDPVVNFQSYIDDNENIVDEDLVAWVTLGALHIPHTEDIPIVTTPGHQLTFMLAPFNYFEEDPSLASKDNVRVDRDQNGRPKVDFNGMDVNVDCQPRTYPHTGASHSGGQFRCSLSLLVFGLALLAQCLLN